MIKSEPFKRGDMELVWITFEWSTEHGECYDCGLPAAYGINGRDAQDTFCSVCAAGYAADGETIYRLTFRHG